jgi:hypothetical protein
MSLATTVAKARKTDPQTSHDAADSVNNITETKRHILKMLRTPKCDDQLIGMWKASKGSPEASESGIRSRRAELVREGRVVDTGKRIQLASGRFAIIWKAVK